MRTKTNPILLAATLFSTSLLAQTLLAQTGPDFEAITKGPSQDWLTYAGDYKGFRLSPLPQITPQNVGSLVPKWVYTLPGARGLKTVPLVHSGVMYVTSTNEVHALDASSGRLIWKYKDTLAKKTDSVNRGAAILGDKVYFVTPDAFLVALDRRNGGLVWRSQFGRIEDGLWATAAPVAIKDKIIVGVAGGDSGMRGYVAAMDAESGKELWRTYTVPKKGEPGAESWKNYIEWGGGATWSSGTYDPELDLLYWPTGNPWPDFNGTERTGDNLYTCSLLALDGKTGKMRWYFQFTPHDVHDWDAQAWPVLADVTWNGKPRKVVFHANRNGFLYVLDRVTGEYLRSTKLIEQLDWATGLDDKGRPMLVPGKEPTPNGNRVCPGVRGAANWMSPTYNPATGLLSVVVLEQCDIFTSSSKEAEPKINFAGGGANPKPKEVGQFFLRAFNPLTGQRVWEYPMTGPANMWAGTVGTKTGLVFFGDDDGQIVAVDGKSGKHLWHFYTGADNMDASPMMYGFDNKAFVAIAAGGSIYSFGLFEPARPIVLPSGKIKKY